MTLVNQLQAPVITLTIPGQEPPSHEKMKEDKVKELRESGESTCVALIRMMTSNMHMILKDDFKQKSTSKTLNQLGQEQ